MSGGVGGVVFLEAALVVPLLFLLWDESPHLVVVSFSKDLIDCLLGYNAIDSSFLQDLVIITGGWFEDISSYAWDQPLYKVSVGRHISKCVFSFGSQLLEVLDVLINKGPGHFDVFETCAGAFAFL